MEQKWDFFLLWLASLACSMIMCGARLGWFLFRVAPMPPLDAAALDIWKLKRRWLILSELSVLPAFATISITIARLRHWPIEGVILLSMALGGLGFAFLLDACSPIRSHMPIGFWDRRNASAGKSTGL